MRRLKVRLFLATVALLLPRPFFLFGQPAPISSIQQVNALTNAQAAKTLPVKVEATVSYVRPSEGNLFLLDGNNGVYVRFRQDIGLIPGDRVSVTGVTAASFRPIIEGQKVRFLAHGSMPKPKPAKYEDLIQSKWDCQYVQISGRVLSASFDDNMPYHNLRIALKVPQGTVTGSISDPGMLRAEDLLDSDVRISGVAGGVFDGKMQLSGIMLDMNSWKDVVFLKHASTDPWSIPVVPMNSAVFALRNSNQSQRVRIAGTLTYFEPGTLAVIEQQDRSMLVKTNSNLSLHTGEGVEATGFPAVLEESVILENGQLRPVAQPAAPPPLTVHWEGASVAQYTYDLVALEGEVVGVVHDSRVDLFLIYSEGHLFSATLRHRSADASALAGPEPMIGSKVRVSGVCFVDAGNHWRDRLWFDLRMRSLRDIVVLEQPSWFTVKRLAFIASGLCIVILIAAIWVGLLDRRLREQTAVVARQNEEDAIRQRRLARQEQQRSHILELISSSEPLPEVLREIQSMVSSRLFGASCWFELKSNSGGSNEVERPSGPAIVFEELCSPNGDSLGFLLATPPLHTSLENEFSAALSAGARLAELAIDTRRLYSDLRHRSEYDLLTDIPNRFSMERKLDQLMQSARTSEAVFGLVYVDLDCFKQINDIYGHRVGDLYLKEVARRMKAQLRNVDMLARIGGDEFIALLPSLRSRADAEQIALRLERCFDGRFDLEGYTLRGSASVGLAVYPEDGASKEELQRSADAAMYAHKELKRCQQRMVDAMPHSESEDSALPFKS